MKLTIFSGIKTAEDFAKFVVATMVMALIITVFLYYNADTPPFLSLLRDVYFYLFCPILAVVALVHGGWKLFAGKSEKNNGHNT